MKSIRVFIGHLETGGTEKHLAYVLPKLVRLGWKIHVILLSGVREVPLANVLQDQGVMIEALLTKKNLRSLSRLPSLIARPYRLYICLKKLYYEFKRDPVSPTYFLLPGAYIVGMFAAYISRFNGYKIMGRRSLNCYQERRFLMKFLEPKIHNYCNFFIANSRAIVNQLIQEEKVPESRLCLIYNGVDTSLFFRKTERSYEKGIIFIIIANLIPYKGHADLLKAFALINDAFGKNWRLICVGQDSKGILSSLQKETYSLGIEKQVQWLTSCADVPELLASADVGILSSHEEGFSNAILEYMSAGLPCIVTDVGGNREAVIDGETGFVVPAKNPKAMAGAILKLLKNPALIDTLGSKGYKRVLEHFSLERCVKSYDTLFESLYHKRMPHIQSDFTMMSESQ